MGSSRGFGPAFYSGRIDMEKNDFKEVAELIFGALQDMTLAQLRAINKITVNRIREAHGTRAQKALARFKEGDQVEFVADKDGKVMRGVVNQLVEPKSLLVLVKPTGQRKQLWRVSANICRLTARDQGGATPAPEAPNDA